MAPTETFDEWLQRTRAKVEDDVTWEKMRHKDPSPRKGLSNAYPEEEGPPLDIFIHEGEGSDYARGFRDGYTTHRAELEAESLATPRDFAQPVEPAFPGAETTLRNEENPIRDNEAARRLALRHLYERLQEVEREQLTLAEECQGDKESFEERFAILRNAVPAGVDEKFKELKQAVQELNFHVHELQSDPQIVDVERLDSRLDAVHERLLKLEGQLGHGPPI